MNEIGVFSFGRRQSQRCSDKMLRPFADTTLTDIVLAKLRAFNPAAFFAGLEPEFAEKCQKAGVRFIQRDERSANIDEPITEILSFLRQVDYRYLLIVNACLPFLKAGTIKNFLDQCRQDCRPAFAVTKVRNFFIDEERRPLNFDLGLKTINTKTVKPVYEFAHALYFFEKDYFFREGRYWDWRKVRFIEAGGRRELIDIDTTEDFQFAEALYKLRQKEGEP